MALIYRTQQLTEVWANSGYWQDIQNAVDQAALAGGGDVRVPEGIFDFVNINEAWTGARVIIPAGVNLFGAPTERTNGFSYNGIGINPNGQVVMWKTTLRLPWDMPGSTLGSDDPPPRGGGPANIFWFKIVGSSDPNKSSRFSDIKLVGYRSVDSHSQYMYAGLSITNVIDWRVDHCYFENIPSGMSVNAGAYSPLRGVFDHNRWINTHGYVVWYILDNSITYGIGITRNGLAADWEDDISKVVGQYTNSTVFIEDSYFSRWRHCVASNDGVHYVFRHNIIEFDSVVGSLDGHGTYNVVGTRAMEIYNNIIIDPIDNFGADKWNSTTPTNGTSGYAVNWRGGGGTFFNNYVRNYRFGIYLLNEGTVEKCYPHNVWIWNNTTINVQDFIMIYNDPVNSAPVEGVDYFLYAPHTFNYQPYPYPHPLVFPPPSPCFIATVAFDSPLAPQLNVFRHFRNHYLPDSIVHVYYRVGKHLARWIENKPVIKRYTREVLNLLAELIRNREA